MYLYNSNKLKFFVRKETANERDGIMSMQERSASPRGVVCSALRVGGGWSNGPRGTTTPLPNQSHSDESQPTARKLLLLLLLPLHTLTNSF